ncbi:MAG: efflux RND transporter periplasmic adaptor subunit [Aliishimia sp.]
MRLFPVLLAIAVSALLYVFVMEREWLYAYVGISTQEDTVVAENESATVENMIKVVALHSKAQMIDSAVVLRGQTEAVRQVEVRSETSSTVVSEPLRKGMFVEAGEDMCVLDPGTRNASLVEARARLVEAKARVSEAEMRVPENTARIAEAEARLEEALSNENAAVQLSKDGYASDTRVKNTRAAVAAALASVEAAKSGTLTSAAGIDSARAGIQSAEANVAAAQTELERIVIKAPFGGLLEVDTAELGSLMQPGTLCGTIIQLDPIKLVAFVPETEVDRVQQGALAGARLAGDDEATIQGRVTFLSRAADPSTRTFRVEIEVPNADLAIRDGQTAEILISAAGEMAHLIPASALTLNDEGLLGIRAVNGEGIVEFYKVSLLRDTPNGVWISGPPEAADIIVRGQEFVTHGVEVAATFQEAKS